MYPDLSVVLGSPRTGFPRRRSSSVLHPKVLSVFDVRDLVLCGPNRRRVATDLAGLLGLVKQASRRLRELQRRRGFDSSDMICGISPPPFVCLVCGG